MSWRLIPASEFASMRAQWDALHAAGAASPLLHGDFVAALLECFAPPGCLLALHEQAAALVVPQGRGSWSTFQPAQAPVGCFLTLPGADAAALGDSLLRALPGLGLVLGLTQCDPWLLARPGDAPRLRALDYIDSAHVEVEGPFEEYWAGRGKNLRANLRKQRQRLERDGIEARLVVARTVDEVATAVAAYGELESRGWKGQEGSAVSAANEQGRFYRRMLEAFCARGAGRIYCYYLGDRLAAMDLCIDGPDHLVVLKTAYDESLGAHLSPALLMREDACRHIFEEGRMRRIEFYGRVMEWHLRWTDRVRTLYHLNCYRWELLRRLHGAA